MPVFNLPPATAGRNYDFVEGFAGRAGITTTLVPDGTDTFNIAGSVYTLIESSDLAAGVVGSSYIALKCVTDGEWIASSIVGTWTLTV